MNNCYTTFKANHFVFALALFFLAVNSLTAQTQWIGPSGGSFHSAANWNNGLPAAGNDANIFGSPEVIISQNTTINFNIQSFGKIIINATVVNNGVLSLSGGVDINGDFTNNGEYKNLGGNTQLATNATFNNQDQLTVQNGDFIANGTVTNSGNITINTTFDNKAGLTNTGLVQIQGTFNSLADFNNESGATVNVANGAQLTNYTENKFRNRAGATLTIFGFLDNLGIFNNNGNITNDGFITNESLMNNNNGGLIDTKKEFTNNATFNNNNNATFRVNSNPAFNKGTFTNNGLLDNRGPFTNEATGIFNNVGTIDNIFGSVFTNKGSLVSTGLISTVGQVTNENQFVNNGEITAPNGGTLTNATTGTLTNNNVVTNLQFIINNGTLINDGRFENDSPGTLTNNATLINELGGFISNDFDVNNYGQFQNIGQIENGVRLYNYATFDNNGVLENIGDFFNEVGGTFNNAKLNGIGGVINNNAGGIFTNSGIFNNENEVFVFECSEFVNTETGTINNAYWFTVTGLIWNFGTINNTQGGGIFYNGIRITGPTNNQICENVSVALNQNGTAKITGVSLSVNSLDNCTTLILTVNGEEELNFDCADLGQNTVTLTLEDRLGNSVDCNATVTIIDEVLPVLQNCPSNISVTTDSNTKNVSWTAPTATDVCGPASLSSNFNPGASFPIGVTQVVYTAVDPSGNSVECTFNVIVAPEGDCADIRHIRKVTNTKTGCGTGSNYVMWLEGNIRYTAGNDLIFVDYKDNTALLTGTIHRGNERAYVNVVYSGKTANAPSGSPKLDNCVSSAANNWRYWPNVSGTVTFSNGDVRHVTRRGPSFQTGTGANVQQANKFGGSGWFTLSNGKKGDFNFNFNGTMPCENSYTVEAECANSIGGQWSVNSDNSASGGKYVAPPAGRTSFNHPPTTNADVLTYTVSVVQSGKYRVFVRSKNPNGSSDSYWIQVNGGSWQKWNKVNIDNQGVYAWDQAGIWNGGHAACPLSFQLNPGNNTIRIAWREPGSRLDKIVVTLGGKEPTGQGETVDGCNDNGNNGGGTPPECNKTALFVVGNTHLNGGDNKIKQRLQSLGYSVQLVNDDHVKTSDANGKGLILISSTVYSGKVGTKFRTVNIPVIVWEAYLYDDMRMTYTAANTHYGNWSSTRKIRITNSNHPITAGISGDVTLFTRNQEITWGMKVGGGQKLGHAVGGPSQKGILLTYEKGAQMRGMTAPARRVGLFLRNNSASYLNNNGWALFDATVAWAGGCGTSQNAVSNDLLTLQASATDERTVLLNWVNNTAYRNDFMQLERSVDGENYEIIDEQYAYVEENDQIELYENVDDAPQIGTNHYRIAIQHTDGSTSYSNIQTVHFADLVEFDLFPNPTTDYVSVNLESVRGETATIQLIDGLGRTILMEEIEEISANTHTIDLQGLQAGRYAVSVLLEGKRPITKQLVVLR